jgi:hypothetical protein
MRAFYATIALWATLVLIAPSGFQPSFVGASDAPEKTVPLIYTQAPNPDAGYEEEVIPPPPPPLDEESNINPR